jgi:hypothetical protein
MNLIMPLQQEPSNMDDTDRSIAGHSISSNIDSLDDSSHDRSNHYRDVSFGTTTVREYERKLDSANPDTALGLTIGWRYVQHEPVTVDFFKGDDEGFREAELMSDEDRAIILLENGYSKRVLRAALKKQWERSGEYQSMVMLKPLRSIPTRVARKISKGTTHFLMNSTSDRHW